MHNPLGKIDCKGLTLKHPNASGNTDQFVVAEVRPSLNLRESSLSIDDSSRLYGAAHGLLLLVADGVGENRESGERASTVAIDAIIHYLLNSFDVRRKLNQIMEQQLLDDLRQSLLDCRSQMKLEVDAADRFSSMDTTLTMAYIAWPTAYVVHVGNNRAYHARNDKLQCLTTDHTVAQRVQGVGAIDRAQADNSSLGKLLWNVLGTTGEECTPDCSIVDLAVGDSMMLCSDGVFKTISENEIGLLLRQNLSAAETCEKILVGGGDQRDDATVVVAKFLDKEEIRGQKVASAENAHHPAATAKASPVSIPKIG